MKTSSTPPKFYFRNNRVLNYIKMINHYLKNNPMNWILIGNILFLLILFRISRIGKKYLSLSKHIEARHYFLKSIQSISLKNIKIIKSLIFFVFTFSPRFVRSLLLNQFLIRPFIRSQL